MASKVSTQIRKGVHNMHPLLVKFVEHYADTNEVSWAAALCALIVWGYASWIDAQGMSYLDVDMGEEGSLYDEYLALPKPRPDIIEWLIEKTRPKPGRPRKEDQPTSLQ